MAWRYAGAKERELVLLVVLAPVTLVATLVGANGYLVGLHRNDAIVPVVNIAVILAAGSWAFFQPAITTPMYSNAYYQEAIKERWLSPLQCQWAAEIVRFREAKGTNGQIRGNVELARGYGMIFHSGVVGSALFTIVLYPLLGTWTWLAFAVWWIPVVIALWMRFRHRMKREGDLAESEGFRMREIGRQMRRQIELARQNPRGRQ